ncbi:hypothetical protein ACFXOS_26080 [Streptomyces sp. NPDC059175]|uniref:hypothetical protein n=1 Tax=Streptomyces sp. NPDC059175 TaxID=3346757 RepID=UPI0036B3746C
MQSVRRSATELHGDSSRICDDAPDAGDRRCSSGWDLPNAADPNRAILGYDGVPGFLNAALTRQDCRKGARDPGRHRRHPLQPQRRQRRTRMSPGAPAAEADVRTPEPRRELPGPLTPSTPSIPSAPPTPTDTVGHPQDMGTAELTATAGDAFTEKISTKAETKAEKAMAEVRPRSTTDTSTDATFTGGEKVAPIPSNTTGVAVAAALRAGDRAVPTRSTEKPPEPCSCK